ncbi:MAG: reverse transcriptase domain-containing protein [Aeromonas sp.]
MKEYCKEMMNEGNKLKLDDEMIIQTMINNISYDNKTLIRLHLKANSTMSEFMEIINTIEMGNGNGRNKGNCEFEKNHTIYQKSDEKSKIDDLMDKLQNLTLSLSEQNKSRENLRMKVKNCYECGKIGHFASECRKKLNESKMKSTNRYDNQYVEVAEIIGKFEKRFNIKFPSYVEELKCIFTDLKYEVPIELERYPRHYNIRGCLKNDKMLRDALNKTIDKTTNINIIKREELQCPEYTILKGDVFINGAKINAIIDTGASMTVLSSKLVEKLNLCMNKNECTELTMAGGQTVFSEGTIENLPIKICKTQYFCEACVLRDATYDLLLGNNFLGKYQTIIDLGRQEMYFPNRGKSFEVLKIKYKFGTVPARKNQETIIPLYSVSKTKLNPNSEQLVEVAIHKDGNVNVEQSTIFIVSGIVNKDYEIVCGVYDTCNYNKPILIQNRSCESITIMKNEKVGYLNLVTDAKIGNLEENCYAKKFEIERIIDSTELSEDHDMLQTFRNNLIALNEERILAEKKQVRHQIKLDPKIEFKNSRRPYRTSIKERDVIDKNIKMMKDENLIGESSSPYSAPIVLVKKKDGTERFCVDYRQLNKATIKDQFPMPRIDDTLDSLGNSNYFSCIDLKSGYWQIPMAIDDREKTAFITNSGLYEWKVMPFGLCNAPATFQRFMNSILAKEDKKHCLVYLDDIIIFSETKQQHMEHLIAVLRQLRKANLKINYKKSVFFTKEIKYLGYIIKQNSVCISEDKKKAILNFPTPKNPRQVQQFIGLASYFRRFVKDFAKICFPLHLKLRKNTIFSWDENDEKSFETLKYYLTNEPILRLPNFKYDFIVTTDACIDGISAILTQKENGVEYAIYFASRITNKHERNYTTFELEGLAIMFAIKIFRCYLLGRKFTLYTDNSAVIYILKNKDHNGRLMRWAIKLQEFDFEIIHKKGVENKAADALSRNACISDVYNKIYTLKKRKLIDEEGGSKNEIEDKKENSNTFLKKEDIIVEAHKELGHASPRTTYEYIKDKYYWSSLRDDVYKVLRSCKQCLSFNDKRPGASNYPLLIGEAFERVGIDLMGPFKTTKRGNKFIVVGIDYLTKFIEIDAIKEKNATNIVDFIYSKIILNHGCPNNILTDNGKEFNNSMVKLLCEKLKVNKKYSSPYRPQTNGLVERTNRTLIAIISKYMNEENVEWDECLEVIRFHYNIRPQENFRI